jgi:hypothetical protein
VTWSEGVPFIDIFVLLFFAFFFETFPVSGSALGHIAVLEGALEYPEAVRACTMRHYPGFSVYSSFILIVFFHSSGCKP